ncbi:hypothetical protein M8C21_000259, partial [Ambrosia artemisiifolia]
LYRQQEEAAARLARQQRTYKLLDDDDDSGETWKKSDIQEDEDEEGTINLKEERRVRETTMIPPEGSAMKHWWRRCESNGAEIEIDDLLFLLLLQAKITIATDLERDGGGEDGFHSHLQVNYIESVRINGLLGSIDANTSDT